MGYSSDSDIEEIEVICDKKSSNGKQSSSKWFDAEELLDIDDDEVTLCEQVEPGRSGVSSKKQKKQKEKNGVKKLGKAKKRADDTSEDDVMSLLSLSPPSSPQAGKKKKAVELFELCSSDEEKKDMAGRSKENYADVSARFADDFFADAEFATLADYLADVRQEKAASASKFVGSSKSSSAGVSSGSGSLAASSQSQTSTGDTGEPASYRVGVGAKKGSRKKPQSASTANGTKKKTKDPENGTASVATASNSNERVKGKVGDDFKALVVQIPEAILTDPLASKLLEREVNFAILETPPVPGCILFEYNVPYKVVGRDFKVQPQVVKEMAEDVLVIFPIEDHLPRLKTEIDCLNQDVPPTTGSLTEWLSNLQNSLEGKNITLLVQGMEAYLRKIQKATQKEYRDRILNIDEPDGNAGKARKATKQKERIVLTRDDIRYVLVGVPLNSDNINYRCYENVSELADNLYHFGRAIAKVPEEKEKAAMAPTDFDMHSLEDNNGGIAIDVDGKGMRSLWVQQLCQFNNVGQERALAVAKLYNCPTKLCQAYQRCSTVEEGENMLTEVKFTSGVGPLAKKRRLGPEASRIIHKFFTGTDGLLELT